MREDNDKQKVSFWTTIPGCVTAIAALITAIGGFIGVLYTIGVIKPRPSPSFPPPITQVFPSPIPSEDNPTIAPYPLEIIDAKGVTMRLVSAGEFIMGSYADDALEECQKYSNDAGDCRRESFVNEEPPHQVYLDSFYMDIYEVTNTLYKTCVDMGACSPPHGSSSNSGDTHPSYYGNSEFDNFPVIFVDWNQAKTYCEWRGAHLPTEAQWEKAARGTDGRTFPWGEGLDCSKANFVSCIGDITKVGNYESGISPFGIYDMAGNVWEWTADWYAGYQDLILSNPLGPDTGEYRVNRGGAYVYPDRNLRSSSRNASSPDGAFVSYIGFRCARDANP